MELPAGDQTAVDQKLPERYIRRRRLLGVERFLKIRRRDETALKQQFSKACFGLAHVGVCP